MRVLISGSMAYDRIMNFPGKFNDHILPEKIHLLNVSFLVDSLNEKFGGTAGNIAYSLNLLGEKSEIIAAVGNDFGRYEYWLNKQGLPQAGIKVFDEVPTAGAYIINDASGNMINAFHPGAMNFEAPFDLDAVKPPDSIGIVSPGCLSDMKKYPERFRRRQIPFIMDPGQNIPTFSKTELLEMIRGSEILIANDYEVEQIRQITEASMGELLTKTKAVITTLGEKGSRIATLEGETQIPAVPVKEVLDPTGAGDAFRSGLLKGLVMKKSLVEAARMGSTCASFSVENFGTQEHFFTQDEFWVRYQSMFA